MECTLHTFGTQDEDQDQTQDEDESLSSSDYWKLFGRKKRT